ncbi:MAG: HAMP domain-containing sensor histidine kinase [Micropepsaceae bacterium]
MTRVFNRLYLKVYATVVVALLLAVFVSATIWANGPEFATARGAFGMASGVAAAALADIGAPKPEQQKSIDRLARLLESDLAVYDSNEVLVGQFGSRLPTPAEVNEDRPRFHGHNPVWKFQLRDGRIIVVRPPLERHMQGPGFLLHLAVVAFILALGSFPVVRGLTRRLERLQQGVETLGAGNLSVRVKVEGRDEVAKVAQSFNRAAARIEELVKAHKMLLANASHELRTPLTRLRLGLERITNQADPKLRADLELDVAELDQLIEGILLSSRLDAMQRLDEVEETDLLALAAEEASRYDDINVSGQSVFVRGDARLLRRLLRNLLDNAVHHGKPPVEVTVVADAALVKLTVTDQGAGIPQGDREKVFEPFFKKPSPSGAERSTGLGLALVRQIALLHGGRASIEGESSFVISLPRCGI